MSKPLPDQDDLIYLMRSMTVTLRASTERLKASNDSMAVSNRKLERSVALVRITTGVVVLTGVLLLAVVVWRYA